MRRLIASFVLLLVAGCAGIASERPGRIYDSGGIAVTEAELVADLKKAQIVVLGEVHDNPIHHARQARIVRQLKPQGIAFEMVPASSEEGVQVFLAEGGARSQIGPAIGWERMGWPEWRLYAPIFEAAEGAYVAGGGAARSEVRQAIQLGAAFAYGSGAGELGLNRPLDAATRVELEDELIAAHCNLLPRQVATGMIEAQRLRDARFAAAALRALSRGGGRTVLITGNGHARIDRGVPAYLRQAAHGLVVLSVGMIEVPEGVDPSTAPPDPRLPFDYIWYSVPAERGDPCAGFG